MGGREERYLPPRQTMADAAPVAIEYATPDRRARPGAALWVAASLVWAGAAVAFAAIAYSVASRLLGNGRINFGEVAIVLLVIVGVVAIEWRAVVGRSSAAASLLAVPAGLVCVPLWIGAIAFAASLFDGAGGLPRPNDSITLAIFVGLAIAATAVAITHGFWASRLREEREREPTTIEEADGRR
jgi:hypothetical protein